MTVSITKLLLCCFAMICSLNVVGQKYLGISVNLGNQINYSPPSEGLNRPLTISGNLLFSFEDKLTNDWVLQQTVSLGILGYNLKVISIDTLLLGEKSVFLDYSTFYGHFDLMIGKNISLAEKKLTIGLGGGVTLYYCPSGDTSYGIGIIDNNNNNEDVFYGEVDCNEFSFAGFAKISTQLELNRRVAVGLAYSYHFNAVINGSYEFYHTTKSSSGNLTLYQREVNLTLYYKLSKKGGHNN